MDTAQTARPKSRQLPAQWIARSPCAQQRNCSAHIARWDFLPRSHESDCPKFCTQPTLHAWAIRSRLGSEKTHAGSYRGCWMRLIVAGINTQSSPVNVLSRSKAADPDLICG